MVKTPILRGRISLPAGQYNCAVLDSRKAVFLETCREDIMWCSANTAPKHHATAMMMLKQ
jgi:hypothetical protein